MGGIALSFFLGIYGVGLLCAEVRWPPIQVYILSFYKRMSNQGLAL